MRGNAAGAADGRVRAPAHDPVDIKVNGQRGGTLFANLALLQQPTELGGHEPFTQGTGRRRKNEA